jgi:hypothetical protein
MRLHPKTDAVQRLIAEGLNNTEIGRTLHIERQTAGHIRRTFGLPNAPRQPLTLEEKWEANTRPVDGGHLEWTGERQSASGTPVLRYREKPHSPAAIAFRIKHQREPAGYAYAECGLKHCVAPDHVDDEAGRTRTREQLRYLTGGKERPPQCAHGHDQAKWGRYETDGRAYCHACKLDAKHQAVA